MQLTNLAPSPPLEEIEPGRRAIRAVLVVTLLALALTFRLKW